MKMAVLIPGAEALMKLIWSHSELFIVLIAIFIDKHKRIIWHWKEDTCFSDEPARIPYFFTLH